MTPRFYIEKVAFNDGKTLICDNDDIIVFVGANNAGKSASLIEISTKFKSKQSTTKVVTDITIAKQGEFTSLKSFFENNSIYRQESGNSSFHGFGYNIPSSSVDHYFSNFLNGLNGLFPFYANVLNTEQRLTAANPAQNIRLTVQPMQHPIHFLQKSDKLEASFSNYFRQAFGMDLVVHRNAGSEVPLYVGEKPIPKQGEDRVSENYH